MYKIEDEKIYHPDELSHMADPQDSYRRECMLIRRIHPSSGEYDVSFNYDHINIGIVIIDEWGQEFKRAYSQTARGVVCVEPNHRFSYWLHKNSKWENVK